MPLFTFVIWDLDGPVSAAATIEADSLELAKGRLTDVLADLEVNGAPPGVIPLHDERGCRVHVRITPEAVADDNNWEEDV